MGERHQRRWRFSMSVMVPVIIAVIVTVGTATSIILWSAGKTDERALDRQSKLVGHMIDKARSDIANHEEDATQWDEAVDALKGDIDLTWVADNLGYDIFDSYGHNRIFVLDPEMKPVYAMRDGGDVAASTFELDRAAVEPVLEKLRSLEGHAAVASFNNGFGDIPHATDIGVVEGKPALIAAVPILSATDEHDVEPGNTYFHVAVRFLDDALAGELTEQFMLEGAHFGSDAGTADGEIAIPVHNNAGTPVAWFKWTPERPGAQILAETVPVMGAALVIAGLIIVVLLFRLKRSSLEIEDARREAQHRALHDPLTGLANRTLFQERLTQALERLGKGGDPVALLALDLDRFKQVNDTLGHEAGDELLQSVTKRIQRLLGDTDTLARLGGDEFVILQSAIKTVSDSQSLSQRIIAKVAEPYSLGAGDARIGVSVGIAVAREPRDALDLVARADFALYQAKDSGRNQARLYDESAPRKTRDGDATAAA